MPPLRRGLLSALIVSAVLAAVAACGASGSPGASPAAPRDPLAGLKPSAVLSRAQSDTEAEGSAHMSGSLTASGKTVALDLTLVRGQGCAGLVTISGLGPMKVVYQEKKAAYFWYSDAFIRGLARSKGLSSAEESVMLRVLSGKWLEEKPSVSSAADFSLFCVLTRLFASYVSPSHGYRHVSFATFEGLRVAKISDVGDSSYSYVSDSARPVLLYVNVGKGAYLRFTQYNAVSTITPPPVADILDGGPVSF